MIKQKKYFTKSLSLNDLDYYSMYRLGIIFLKDRNILKLLSYLEKLSLIKDIYFIHSEEFLMEIALCYYYTNNLILAKIF